MTKALNTLNIADRLHDIICELSVIDYALLGSCGRDAGMTDAAASGFSMILARQREAIEAISEEIHPPRPAKAQGQGEGQSEREGR